MKNILTLLLIATLSISAIGQTNIPQLVSFSAVVRDGNNQPLVNTPVSIRLTFREGGQTGPLVYCALHQTTTNQNGFMSLQLNRDVLGTGCNGAPSTAFENIAWDNGDFWMEVEYQTTPSTPFENLGQLELASSFYAFAAGTAESISGMELSGASNGDVLTYNITTGQWEPMPSGGGGFSGDYNDLTNTPTIPTNTSDLTNNSGFITNPDDADADATNELQNWSNLPGIPANIDIDATDDFSGDYNDLTNQPTIPIVPSNVSAFTNDAGYVITSDDADADATNELQNITLTGTDLSITNGGTVDLSIIQDGTTDADADSTNELQTLSEANGVLSLSNGGGSVILTDNVDDADADATNELQTLSVSSTADTLYLQNGGFVIIPGISVANMPTLTTSAASNLTTVSATLGGNITNQGGSSVTQRGVCYSTSISPTTANSITNDGSGTGSFSSNLVGLTANTTYYVRAYATNSAGTAYGNEASFNTFPLLATLTTASASNLTTVSATLGGNMTNQGGGSVTQRGVCYSTSTSPTTANSITNDGSGTGSFSSNLVGLTANTTYYVRAYATNSAGTAYGNEVTFTLCAAGTTAIVDVASPATGAIWMDRNLGATQAATSSTDADSYGDLYQWGRFSDGHQCPTSATTSALSSTDQPAHNDFILGTDWRSPQNDNLWQGVNGINNPCPSGYRLPTESELDAERVSWSSNDVAGAIASPLKLPLTYYGRSYSDGSLMQVGTYASYWSSTVSGPSSRYLDLQINSASIDSSSRGFGCSVRCIKD